MAEVVQLQIEDRIPELEQLERVGLFTSKEIRAVIKRVSALEYKIHRRAIGKEDFINYVQYEINLLELIKKRRSHIGYFFKKDEIEFSIVQRIHRIFKRATTKWKSDLQLWLSHVAFCKKWNCKTQLSKLFSSMLAIHPDKPGLWIMAAKWEMEDRLSSESARHLFLRAVRFHPESPKVFQEYFRMEMMHAEKQRKEKEEIEHAKMDVSALDYSDQILSGGLARVIYKDAIQKIKGAEFHICLLSIVKLFNFAQELQKEILEDLQSLHADDPLTWDFMARRELEMDCLPSAEHASKQTKAMDLDRKEQRCCAVYETAVDSVSSAPMWKCFVTFCLERFKRKSNNEDLRQKRQDRLFSAFRRAHDSDLLEEGLYIEWLQLLLEVNHPETAVEIAAAATKRFSQSVQMWQTRLQVLIKLKNGDTALHFEEAFKQVKTKDSLPLWILWLQWSEEAQTADATEAIFQRAVFVPAVSVTMKEKYLDWAHRTSGYKKAKKVFTSLRENRPLSLEFFRKMIQIEKEQETCKMLNLREYYERALRDFGSSDADLWLAYIKEELSHPHGKPENCSQIHWRAMKCLQEEQVEDFVSKYTLLQTGHL